jgi:predicted Zn-dependent protease
MSGTQNGYPFAIWYYTIPGTQISNSVGAPDLVNGILGAQASLASTLFSDTSSIGALKPLTKLAVGAGVLFDVVNGVLKNETTSEIVGATALDTALSVGLASLATGGLTLLGVTGAPVVIAAVTAGFIGSQVANWISGSQNFQNFVNALGTAAQNALAATGEYSMTYDIGGVGVPIDIYSNGNISVPSQGVTFQSNGQISVPGGTLSPVAAGNSANGFDYQFTPSGGGTTTSFGATFVPPASGSTTPGIQFTWDDGTNGNQTTSVIPLPPTSSYANPQVTQTYDSTTNQLTLWNHTNNTAEVVQYASGSTTEITQISDVQFTYNSSGQLQSTNIENYNTLNQEISADYFSGNNVQIWTYDPSTGAATNEQAWSGNTLVNQIYFSNSANQLWSSYQVNYNNSFQMTSQDIFEKNGSVQIWNFNAPSTSAVSEQNWNNNQLQSQTFFNWNNNTSLNWNAETDYYNYTNAGNPYQINSEAVFLKSGINQLWLYNLQYYGISNETVQQWQGNQLENEILFPNTSAANWSYVYVPFSNGMAQSATYYNSAGDIVNPTYAVASLPPPQQPPSSSTSSVTGTGGGGAGSAPGSVLLDGSAAAAAVGDAISASTGGPSVIGTVVTVLGDILGFGTVRGASNLRNIVSQSDLAAGLPAAALAADAAWANMEQNLAAAENHTPAPSPFEGAKWANAVITWSFADSPGSRSMPFSGYVQKRYQAAIEAAIQTWSNASGLKFKQVSGSSTADIRIGWGNFNTQNSGIIGLTGSQVAGGQFQPGTIVRLENPAQDPIVSGSGALEYAGTDVRLYQVALHEIGHALGLADTSDPNSVMFANLGTTNRSLDATDTRNIKTLYGSGSPLGSGSSGVLAQAMASFDPLSPLGSTQPSPPLTALEPTLAANMHH